MRARRVLLAGLAALSLASGCAGVVYQKAYTADGKINLNPASPPPGAFAFALRKSIIVLTAGPGTDSASASPAAGASAATPPVAIDCNGEPHHACAGKIIVAATPTTDTGTAYFATPRSGARWLGGTTLSPKSDATDPLLIQSVTFGYNNKVANIVTAAGTGFTTGLSFGPAGAWTGLLLGAAGAAIPPHRLADGDQRVLARVVCAPAEIPMLSAPTLATPPMAVRLSLPVTVDYPTVDPVAGCWHALPDAPSAKASASTPPRSTANAGWFYRVLPTDTKPAEAPAVPPILSMKTLQDPLPTPFALADPYFADGQPKTSFPVSACRSVAVELAWWQDIVGIKPAESLSVGAVSQVAKTLVVAAADPNVVQLLDVSSGTSVTILSCGGFAAPGAPSTAIADDISAVIKQAQAIKAAETPTAAKKQP
jgi:hypothetical protein